MGVALSIPRILYAIKLVPGAQVGSLEDQICMLAPKVEEAGGRFIVLFTEDRAISLAHYQSRGIDAEYIDLTRFRFSSLIALLRLMRRHQIELVHWNMQDPIRNPYLWTLSLLQPGVRHCMTDHQSREPSAACPKTLSAYLKGFLARRYKGIFCVSRFIEDWWRREAIGAKTSTQYHFIDVQRFRPDPSVRRRVREGEQLGEQIVALVVGYLIPQKGVEIALRAVAGTSNNLVLWIIGGGPEQQRIAELCEKLDLSDRTRMFGPLQHVDSYLQAADVLICPSVWAEAAGLVNLEAQACGLPVIASRVGGIPEHVLDERTGLIFAPGDSGDLSRQLNRIIDEPDLRQRLALAARPWVLEMFSPDLRIPEILDRYRSLGG